MYKYSTVRVVKQKMLYERVSNKYKNELQKQQSKATICFSLPKQHLLNLTGIFFTLTTFFLFAILDNILRICVCMCACH